MFFIYLFIYLFVFSNSCAEQFLDAFLRTCIFQPSRQQTFTETKGNRLILLENFGEINLLSRSIRAIWGEGWVGTKEKNLQISDLKKVISLLSFTDVLSVIRLFIHVGGWLVGWFVQIHFSLNFF